MLVDSTSGGCLNLSHLFNPCLNRIVFTHNNVIEYISPSIQIFKCTYNGQIVSISKIYIVFLFSTLARNIINKLQQHIEQNYLSNIIYTHQLNERPISQLTLPLITQHKVYLRNFTVYGISDIPQTKYITTRTIWYVQIEFGIFYWYVFTRITCNHNSLIQLFLCIFKPEPQKILGPLYKQLVL
ncbi:Hypothetical_protein [Hexamita inflata]|uniref:Hypothetical_protein n=1 Tax=Hexamita inflata TaxID=28002 RepID=A0AA86RGP2_9EUKA|nr:Hypothetical protein HINF_LOCUS54415 [Hexamita inflata]